MAITMKKTLCLLLALLMIAASGITVSAETVSTAESAAPSFAIQQALYVHAVASSADTEAWQMWQSVHDRDMKDVDSFEKYFFLPSSADSKKVDIYNGFDSELKIGGQTLPPRATTEIEYSCDTIYRVKVGDNTYRLTFMNSSA